MATSIWKKLADVAGFTNVGNLFGAIGRGDWSRAGYEFAAMPYEYVQNIKNWNNDSVDSSGNSAVSIDTDAVKAENVGPLVNQDGSSNFGGITKLEDLGPMVTEAVIGAIPEIQRQWSSAEAQKERDWQTALSNSAIQRSVADMKAAGINPILAYQQGGASSGIGASASAPSSSNSLGSSLQGLAQVISTIMREDRLSDKDTQNASLNMLKYQDTHSATQASNEYYKNLNKINKLKLAETHKRLKYDPDYKLGL